MSTGSEKRQSLPPEGDGRGRAYSFLRMGRGKTVFLREGIFTPAPKVSADIYYFRYFIPNSKIIFTISIDTGI